MVRVKLDQTGEIIEVEDEDLEKVRVHALQVVAWKVTS